MGNYNDVEAVFLVCSIFICVSGIMFASGYFENEYYRAQGVVLQVVAFGVIMCSIFYYTYVIGKEIKGVALSRREKNKAKWSAFKQKANFHKDLFSLDNANATETEKKAASKIEAAFLGKKTRADLHAKIEKDGTPEQKAKLKHLEETRRRRKSRSGRRRSRSRSRSRSRRRRDPNETPEERAQRKERQLKRRETRRKKREEERQRRREHGDGDETARRHQREGIADVAQTSAKEA